MSFGGTIRSIDSSIQKHSGKHQIALRKASQRRRRGIALAEMGLQLSAKNQKMKMRGKKSSMQRTAKQPRSGGKLSYIAHVVVKTTSNLRHAT
jgi:uncharacterized protein YjbK